MRKSGVHWLGALVGALIACGASPDEGGTQDFAATAEVPENWEASRAQREQAVDRYLSAHAAAFASFKNGPLGFNGAPYVLLRVLRERYPDIWNPSGDGDLVGFFPHLEQGHVLPYGLGVASEKEVYDAAGLPVTPRPDDPDPTIQKVLFTCGGCHTGRVVVDGKVKHLFGAPNSEVDAPRYNELIMRTVFEKLVDNPEERDPAKIRPKAAEIGALLQHLGSKVTDPTYDAAQIGKVLAAAEATVGALIGMGIRTRILFFDLPTLSGSYFTRDGALAVHDDRTAPAVFGSRPGQIDAFGISAGLVFLHLSKPKEMGRFLADTATFPDDHAFFRGLTGSRDARETAATGRLLASAGEWLPHLPGPADIKSIHMMHERNLAGWDGNQGAHARVIGSGTSTVGEPAAVNRPLHAAMNGFIDRLPAAPYPFAIDVTRAKEGRNLFARECASCHKPNNRAIYVDRELDQNRANLIVDDRLRDGLVGLVRQACAGDASCTPPGSRAEADEALLTVRPPEKRGYKADTLVGIWSQAPYLHNGSVPTIWHLLHPSQRPPTFIRGNIHYDEGRLGFVWDAAPARGSYPNVHTAIFDTALGGQDNRGHRYGEELAEDAKYALIEYLKTL